MKNIFQYSIASLLLVLCLSSCYEDNDYWLDENIKSGGSYLPVIQRFSVEGDPIAGEEVSLRLQYWSRDEIDRIEFFAGSIGDLQLIATVGDDGTFDPVSEALVYNQAYVLPDSSSGQDLRFAARITTVNELGRNVGIDITVE